MRLSNSDSTNYSLRYYYGRKWKLFCASLILLKHQDNLEELFDWSARKRFSGLGNHYWQLLQGVDKYLYRINFEAPILVGLAKLLHCAREMLFPPTYYKGFATQYNKSKKRSK